MGKIIKNSLFLTGSQVIARAIGFLYLIFLGRQLGVEQFGIYVFTISLVYNFVPVADFGIERLVMRDIARKHEDAQYYFSRLAPLKLLTAFISVVLTLVLGLVLKLDTARLSYLVIFSLGLIPIGLVTLIVAIAAAKERMKIMALANILLISSYALFGLLFYFTGGGITRILLAYPIANVLILLFLTFNLKRWGLKLEFKPEIGFWKKIIKESWVFGLINIGAVFYLRLTLILVGTYLTATQIGLYGSVFKFIDAGILLPQAITLALFPLSSRLFNSDRLKLKGIYIKAWLTLFGLGLLAMAGIQLFGETLIRLTYGVEYMSAVGIFKILSFAVILFFVNSLPGNVIQNSPKVKLFLPFALVNYLVTLVVGILIIPRFGMVGAGLTLITGELIGLVVNNYLVFKLLNEKNS